MIMDGWDWRDVLVGVGFACLAVGALVRLMLGYREAVIRDVRRQIDEQRGHPGSSVKDGSPLDTPG